MFNFFIKLKQFVILWGYGPQLLIMNIPIGSRTNLLYHRSISVCFNQTFKFSSLSLCYMFAHSQTVPHHLNTNLTTILCRKTHQKLYSGPPYTIQCYNLYNESIPSSHIICCMYSTKCTMVDR